MVEAIQILDSLQYMFTTSAEATMHVVTAL